MITASTFLSPDTRGHKPLWLVFWIYGVLASHILFGAILYLYSRVGTPAFAMLLGGFVVYTSWIMRLVWINAFNVTNENYAYIARALTVVWALNAVLVSMFLFLGHLGAVPLPL